MECLVYSKSRLDIPSGTCLLLIDGFWFFLSLSNLMDNGAPYPSKTAKSSPWGINKPVNSRWDVWQRSLTKEIEKDEQAVTVFCHLGYHQPKCFVRQFMQLEGQSEPVLLTVLCVALALPQAFLWPDDLGWEHMLLSTGQCFFPVASSFRFGKTSKLLKPSSISIHWT